jgi:hypothetical protein
MAFSPIVTPPSIVLPAPMDALFLINVLCNVKSFLALGYLSFVNVTLGPICTLSSIVIPSHK